MMHKDEYLSEGIPEDGKRCSTHAYNRPVWNGYHLTVDDGPMHRCAEPGYRRDGEVRFSDSLRAFAR